MVILCRKDRKEHKSFVNFVFSLRRGYIALGTSCGFLRVSRSVRAVSRFVPAQPGRRFLPGRPVSLYNHDPMNKKQEAGSVVGLRVLDGVERALLCVILSGGVALGAAAKPAWEAESVQTRPWVYNWWMGSAVTETDLEE